MVGDLVPDLSTVPDTVAARVTRAQGVSTFASSIKAKSLMAVVANAEDAEVSEWDEDDSMFWLAVAVAKAFKAKSQISVDTMVIKKDQWAVKIRWFKHIKTIAAGEVYRQESQEVFTIPVNSCLYAEDLQWKEVDGATGRCILSHEDAKVIRAEREAYA